MGRSSKDKRDIFYRLAKEEGWRARSAFKLLQIAQQFDLFNGVHRAVDLCAAPGSWSQVLAQALKGSKKDETAAAEEFDKESEETFIVAVDLQKMSPIPGVICLTGDITKESTAREIIKCLGEKKAEIVVCDGAPDVTGLHQLDEYLQGQLILAALNIATFVLAPGGSFLAKIFRASQDGVDVLYAKVKIFFEDVLITKPRSSRASSIESFILARNFRLPPNFSPILYDPFSIQDEIFKNLKVDEKQIIRFVACGDLDGFDSDTTYPIDTPDYISKEPVQSPISPPYEEAIARRRNNGLAAPSTSNSSKITEVEEKFRELNLTFGGGAELLVGNVREKKILLPYKKNESTTMKDLIEWMKSNVLVDRPELLILDDDVRPGILCLINDTDWELYDKLDAQLNDSDKVSFISTLHGG